MKKILYCLVLAVMLTACGGETKKTEANQEETQVEAPKKVETKQVGDIITINDAEGIVYEVSADGLHGMAMSVLQAEYPWDRADDWCYEYGSGWRLPNANELIAIYANKDILNSALSAKGYQTINDGWYWTYKETDSTRAVGVEMEGGRDYSYKIKRDYYSVRAVSAF